MKGFIITTETVTGGWLFISPDRRLSNKWRRTWPIRPEELSENFNTFCQTFRIHRSERPFPTFTTWNSASDSSGKRSLETKRPVWLKCNRSWMNCSDVLRKCAGLNGFTAKGNYPNALPIAIQKSTICCSIRMTVFFVWSTSTQRCLDLYCRISVTLSVPLPIKEQKTIKNWTG